MIEQVFFDFGKAAAMPARINADTVNAWGIRLDRDGVHWMPAALVRRTRSRVTILFEGKTAVLGAEAFDAGLSWSSRHHCRFAKKRGGLAEIVMEAVWAAKFGAVIRSSMPLVKARVLLGLPNDYTPQDIKAAFRDRAKTAHPDRGGNEVDFRILISARDLLLAQIGEAGQ